MSTSAGEQPRVWDLSPPLLTRLLIIFRWLTLEPFIVPGMFEPFNSNTDDGNGQNNAIDEWTLSIALGSNLTAAMTEHYETFIVSQSSGHGFLDVLTLDATD